MRRSNGWEASHARGKARAYWLAAIVLPGAACDLPPGIPTLGPGEGGSTPVGVAEVHRPPADEPWVTDYLAWQPGGEMACLPTPAPIGAPPLPGNGTPEPFVLEIWDGLEGGCGGTPPSGSRSIRISFSDRITGVFPVSTACSGPLSAGAVYRTFLGTEERRQAATEGSVTITGITSDDVVEGAFSVLFQGDGIVTSGGFRAALDCVQGP